MLHVHIHSTENSVDHLGAGSLGRFLICLTRRSHENGVLSLKRDKQSALMDLRVNGYYQGQ